MKQTQMYVCTLEEFILVDIWIHCCTSWKQITFPVIHFRNAPFEAVALQSSQRLPELLFYTKKSYRILQFQFYKGTHTTSIHMQHTSIQRILHPESNSTCRRQRALRVLLLYTEGKETFIPEKKFYA